MIINASGLAKYSKIFSNPEKYNDQLIAGFLTAINAFSQETFGAKFLTQISYKEFLLLFDTIEDFKLVYAFKGDQKKAERTMQNLKNELRNDKYKFVFIEDNKEIDSNSPLTELVNKYF